MTETPEQKQGRRRARTALARAIYDADKAGVSFASMYDLLAESEAESKCDACERREMADPKCEYCGNYR